MGINKQTNKQKTSSVFLNMIKAEKNNTKARATHTFKEIPINNPHPPMQNVLFEVGRSSGSDFGFHFDRRDVSSL